MLNSHLSQVNPLLAGTPTPGAILMVESNPILRESRARLLSALNLPVLKVSSYSDVYRLAESASINLAVINLLPNEVDAREVAAHVRRQWPSAKVFALGHIKDPVRRPSIR